MNVFGKILCALAVAAAALATANPAQAREGTAVKCGDKNDSGKDYETLEKRTDGKDLWVLGNCKVPAGTYTYGDVNIYGKGTLTFQDEVVEFWARNIVVENGGSLLAGVPAPIGTAGGKLTIHLYGADQGVNPGGVGVDCIQKYCGIPETVWTSNGERKVPIPNVADDYFYTYGPLMYDGGKLPADTRQGTEYGFFGYKVIAVSYGGTVQLFGKKGATYGNLDVSDPGRSWVRLAGTVSKGKQFTVETSVVDKSPADSGVSWKQGDKIVLTTTDYLPGHSEELTIDFIEADGKTIHVLEDVRYRHQGEKYLLPSDTGRLQLGFSSIETRAAVALLSRSIQIVSEGPDATPNGFPASPGTYFGGHMIARQGFKAFQVQGVEFKQMGQGGRMGHYPVHFHMAQTTPSNTYVKDSSVNESMTRWMVVHATNGVTFARNVGWKSIGHGFYIEEGSEIDNKFQTNIGIYARPAIDEKTVNPRKVPGILAADRINLDDNVPFHTDVDHPTAFWIMNGWNDFEYNVAVGAGTCGACYWLLPGANSGMSRSEPMVRNLKGYAALQGSEVVTTVPMVDNPLGRAGLTPLRKFIGNSCTAAMNSLNTIGNAASCQGSGGLGNPMIPAVRNPYNLPRPCDQTNPPIRDKDDRIIGFVSYACANEANKEADDYYPKVTGVRNATLCEPTAANNYCLTAAPCDRGHLDSCAVTVIDRYTSSFHMGAETNFGAMWLRGPGWFLVTNSALTDAQNAGLSIVSGGGYTESDVNQGRWALVRKTVFVGATQDPAKPDASGFASPYGPFNPKGLPIVDGTTCSDDHCVSAPDGITVPVNNFAMNQRMFNIYDGPTYQDSNAYLDIRKLPITDCQKSSNGSNCKSTTLAGRVLGLPYDASLGCYMPNAAIAWKQPNGFYYPPAFHSANLYFGVGTVDIRHFVIEPIFEPGTYTTKVDGPDGVKAKYCNWNPGMFTGYTDVDRQTELSDDDGSLTGYQKTVSVNNDSFFSAPTEEVECESDGTAKTSPYDYVTSVVYPGCAMTGTCCPPGETCREPDKPNWFWAEPCSNETCYGVPMYRQLITEAEKAKGERPFIRMAGQSTRQRSTLTPNNGKFYVDTTVSYAKQKATSRYINEFREGEKYYLFLLFAKPETTQTYQIYVGENFNPDDLEQLWATRADVRGVPYKINEVNPLPKSWTKKYANGVLEITMTMKDFDGFNDNYKAAFQDNCQPGNFCSWSSNAALPTGGTCGCNASSPFAKQCGDLNNAGENVCAWAQKAVDCPKGGCYGIGFKMATMTYDTVKPPEPGTFPAGLPWFTDFTPAANGVAQSCTPKSKSRSAIAGRR
jgi:hypothetical protein